MSETSEMAKAAICATLDIVLAGVESAAAATAVKTLATATEALSLYRKSGSSTDSGRNVRNVRNV